MRNKFITLAFLLIGTTGALKLNAQEKLPEYGDINDLTHKRPAQNRVVSY